MELWLRDGVIGGGWLVDAFFLVYDSMEVLSGFFLTPFFFGGGRGVRYRRSYV